MIRRFLVNYARRHAHPWNRAFHAVGLPVTFLAPIAALAMGESVLALSLFLMGYCLQFVGHAIEGNDAGETVLLKRALGLPFVDIVPVGKTVKDTSNLRR